LFTASPFNHTHTHPCAFLFFLVRSFAMVLPDSLPPVQSRDMVPPRPAAAASDRGLNASGARARASSLLLAAAGAHGLHFVAGSSAVAAIASSDLRESHRPYVTGDWQRDDASGAVTLKIEVNVPRAAAWAFAPASPRSLPPPEAAGANVCRNVSSDLIGFSRFEQSSPPMQASQSTIADASAHSTSTDASSESISARGPRTRPPARDSTSNGATLIAHGVLTVVDRLISQRHADWLRDSSAAPEVELRFVCADPDFDGAELRTTELFRLASRYCDCFGKALQQSCVALRACFANGGASVSAPQHVTVLVDALPPTVSKFLAGTVVDDIIRSAGIDRASCTVRIANRHDEMRPFLLDRHAHLVREHARRALMTSEFDERERLEAAAMQELILTGSHYRTMIDHVLVERRTQDDEIEASASIVKIASVSVSQSMFVDGLDEPTARLLRQERTARAKLQATLFAVDDVDSPSVHHRRNRSPFRGGAESWYGRVGGLYGFMLAHARATSELIRLEDSARTAMNGFAGIRIQRMNLVAREEISRPHVERRLMQEFTTAVADSVVGFLVPGWYAVALRHNTFLARLCVDITRYTDHVVAYMTQLQTVFLELCESGRVRLGLLHAANAAWHTRRRLITALLDMVTHDEPAARQLAQSEESAARGLLEARFALNVACPIAEAKARKDLNQRQATWFRNTIATFTVRLDETSARSVVAGQEQTARHVVRCQSDEAMNRRYIQRDASFIFIGTPRGGTPVHIDHLHQMHTTVCAALRSHGLWQQVASEAMNTLRRRVHDRCHLLVDEAASRKVVADGCASSRFVALAILAKTCAKRSLELEICEIAFRARTSRDGTQEVSLLRRCAASVRAILEAEDQERAVLATTASHSLGAVSNVERNRSFVRDAAQTHMRRQSIHLCEHTETVTRAAFSGSLLLELHQWHRISRTIAEDIATRAGLERVAFATLDSVSITAAQAHARLRLELRAFRKHNNHAVCAMSEVDVIRDYAAAVGTTLVDEASERLALHRAFSHARSVAAATESSRLFCAQALMAVQHRGALLYVEHLEFVERIRTAACAMLRVDRWRCVSALSLCEYQARASLAAQALARALVLVSESEAFSRRQLASHAFVDLQAVVCSSHRAAVEIHEIGHRAQIVAAAQFMVHRILRCLFTEDANRVHLSQAEAAERHTILDNYQQRRLISVEDAEAGSRSQIDVDARSALDRDVVLPCEEEAARIVIRTKQMSARGSLRCIEQAARFTTTESEARRLLENELRTNTAILFHALSEEVALCAREGRTRQLITVHADNVVSMLRDAARTRCVLVTAEACERATLRTTAAFVAHAIQRLSQSQDLMLTELAELWRRAAISMVSFSHLRHYFQTSTFILSESHARAEITQTEAAKRHTILDNYQQRQRISVEDAEAGSRSQIDVDARSALDRDVVLPCEEEAARIVIRAKQMSARGSLRRIEQAARLTATESEARRLLEDELRTNTAILFHALSEEAALCAREGRTRQFITVHADNVVSMLRDAARTRRVLVTAEASDRTALRTTAAFVAHAIQRLSQSQDLMLTELTEILRRATISMVAFSQLRHYFQTSTVILSESRARAQITQTEADERHAILDNYQQRQRISVEDAEAGSRSQIDVDARSALDRDVVLPCEEEAARIVIRTKQMSARGSLRRIEQAARLTATESEARRLLVDELRTNTAILFHALSEEAALCAREGRTRQLITLHADNVVSMLRDAARTRCVLVTAEASERATLRTTAAFVAHAIQRLSQSQDLMLTELAELLKRAAISMVSFSQLRHYFQTSTFILSESRARAQIASDLHIQTVNVLGSAESSARRALMAEAGAAHNMVYQRAECSAASVEEALQRKWASQHATFTLHYAIPLEFAEGAKRIELACDCVAQRNAILAQRQVAWIQQDEAQSRLSLTAEFTDSISTLTARLNARLRVVSTEERDRHALIREASAAIALHGAVALRRLDVLLAEAAERSALSRHHACIVQLLEARSFAQRSLVLEHGETIKRARLAVKAIGTLLDLLTVSRVVQNEHTSRLAVEHRAAAFHFERFQQAEELARAVVVEGAVQNHRGLAQQCQRAELHLQETLQRRQLTTAAVLAIQMMSVESDEAISRLRFAASQAQEREFLASSLRFTRLVADESELRFAVVLQEQAAATSLFHTLETEKNIITSENAQRRAVISVAYGAGDVLREMTLARLQSLISEQRERMELRATFAFVTHSVMTSASRCELFLAEHADVVLRSTIAVRALAQVSLWHALTTTTVNEAAARATAQAERVMQAMRTLVLIESSARHGIVAEATQSSAMIMDAARFQTVSLREQQRRSLVVMAAHVRLGGVIPLQFVEGSQRISIREDEASQRASFVAAHRAARLAAQETQGRLSISLRQQTSATTLFNLLTGETTVVIGESRERQVVEAAAAQVGEFTGLWIRDRVTVLASEASSRRSLQHGVTESLLLATEAADRRRLFASQSSTYLRLRQLQSRYTALYLSLASNAAYWHAIGKPEFTQREKLLHRVFNRSVAGSHAALLAGLKVQTDEAAARYGVKLAFETEVARLRAVEFVERRKIDPSTVVSSVLLQVPAAPSAR
jgi:ureidoglycolate hydrolase